MGSALNNVAVDTVAAILGAVGVAGTLTRTDTTNYDAEHGYEATATPVAYAVVVSPPIAYTAREREGTSIKKTDVRFILQAKNLAVEPLPEKDVLTVNSIKYRIVGIEKLTGGLTDAGYDMQCRKE